MGRTTVHLFVFDTLADWEASYAIAGINRPYMPGGPSYRVRTAGLTREPVTTMGGVTILPDQTLAEVDPAESALLILPGGDRWEVDGLGEALPEIVRLHAAGLPLAAICGATAGLARAGLLDRAAHTSNAREYLAATGYGGAGHYRDEPAVSEGQLITAGAAGALAFAAAIFRRLELYPQPVIDAWLELFRTGDPVHYAQLVVASGAA